MQLTQEPARSAPCQQPGWGRETMNMKVNRSRANKDTNLPSEGGHPIPPARAKPPTQLTPLIHGSERRQPTCGPSPPSQGGVHPTLLQESGGGGVSGVVVVSPFQRAERSGHLRSRAPGPACPQMLLGAKAVPISELLWHLLPRSYFYISFPHIMAIYILHHEGLKHKPETITHHGDPRRNPNPEEVSEVSC